MPPAALGKHGMTRNRFKKLRKIIPMFFDKDEEDLRPDDPWRYSKPPFVMFNEWRQKKYVASWLLTEDELLLLYLGQHGFPLSGKGGNSKLLPSLSFVPRKPDPLGCEVKVLAGHVNRDKI